MKPQTIYNYEFQKEGYTFKVVPEDREQVKLLVEMPETAKELPKELLYEAICEISEHFSEAEWEMIRYNFYYFKRGISMIEFCAEVCKKVKVKPSFNKSRISF